jgi:hypothetical protein
MRRFAPRSARTTPVDRKRTNNGDRYVGPLNAGFVTHRFSTLIFGLTGLLLAVRLLILSVAVADEWIQGTVVIDRERGTAVARYFVSFYPAPPDHRPCVNSEKGLCFEKAFTKNELLDTFREADVWLEYTPLNELTGKAFICVIRTSVHDRLLQP